MSLKEKLLKNSTIKETSILTDSEYFNGSGIVVPTVVPMLNVALSGKLNGGLTAGVNMIAGASRSFKTAFALLLAGAYLKKFPDGIVLFYDSEFGTNESYFKNFNVDKDKIIHTPMTSVEQLRHDISVQLEDIKRGEHLLIIMDSLGNLASKKEVEDALEGKSAADMTRAKVIKSLFRIITPHLVMKDIPLIVVNHTYKEMSLFPKDIVSGGTGGMYNANGIWIVSRSQDKQGDELRGWHFTINIEKSRFLKEKSKIAITVSFEAGINPWSGLLELAEEYGIIGKPKKGWYQRLNGKEFFGQLYRENDIDTNDELWKAIFKETDFANWIESKYMIETADSAVDHSIEIEELLAKDE